MTKKHFIQLNIFLLLLLHSNAFAQNLHDSLYYKTFPDVLTVRVYSVKDYADFSLSSFNKKSNLQYRSNTTINLGTGVTYKNVSANFSAGFGFLNKGIEKRGKTTALDFQFHLFPQKWTSDFLFLHYKGFYATPGSYPAQLPGNYYRPDVNLNLIGLSAYSIQNFRKFSYRSAFFQNEWMRKSAGTLLYGASIYYESINSNDSSLIPHKVTNFPPNADFNHLHFISVGPGIGYAYTLVMKKHFYVLGSAIINGNINFSTDDNGSILNRRTGFEPGLNFKSAAGYGGTSWNASLSFAGNVILAKQANGSNANIFSASELRLTFAKQIRLKKPVPVVSSVIDAIFGKED